MKISIGRIYGSSGRRFKDSNYGTAPAILTIRENIIVEYWMNDLFIYILDPLMPRYGILRTHRLVAMRIIIENNNIISYINLLDFSFANLHSIFARLY